MERALFFDSQTVNGEPDRTYAASDVAAMIGAFFTDGVLGTDALYADPNADMSLTVYSGAAVIAGYTYVSDEDVTLALENSPSALSRIDLAVLRLDLDARTVIPTVITGTPAQNPALPAYNRSGSKRDLPIAKIRIPAGATSAIRDCEITDMRSHASFTGVNDQTKLLVSEAISGLSLLSMTERNAARALIAAIKLNSKPSEVLCGDGQYRKFDVLSRVELTRYDAHGEYEFSTAAYPSENGLYDVIVQGAGGGGGTVEGIGKRGGGGGAGAYVCVSHMPLNGSVKITVGKGGSGVAGGDGEDGTPSVFGRVFAAGGRGGKGVAPYSGGAGGQSGAFYGGDGHDGSGAVAGETYITDCGMGGSSGFGNGAHGAPVPDVSVGANAVNPGSGGSGGGGPAAVLAAAKGGRGADGLVIVYGYVSPGNEGA